MATVNFVLSPEATARFYDVILCLAKFSESVGIEAKREKVSLTLSLQIPLSEPRPVRPYCFEHLEDRIGFFHVREGDLFPILPLFHPADS